MIIQDNEMDYRLVHEECVFVYENKKYTALVSESRWSERESKGFLASPDSVSSVILPSEFM